MPGQRVGYVRVSSIGQNADRQLDGLALDRVFIDRASGKDSKRLELVAMFTFVQEGDLVEVKSMEVLVHRYSELVT